MLALGVVTSLANQVNYAVLFSGMTSSDAGDVYNKLQEMGVDVKAEGDGTILVPQEQVNQLRYQLNSEGYPKSGLNFDFYTTNATSFGMTDQDKRLYLQFQLEQNISQTINQMDKIKGSTVMITLPEESSFVLSGNNGSKATASVVLNLKRRTVPELQTTRLPSARSSPRACKNLAPAGHHHCRLQHEHIQCESSIGRGWDRIGERATGTAGAGCGKAPTADIESVVTPVFGSEKLSASVNVLLNFDKSTTNSITLSRRLWTTVIIHWHHYHKHETDSRSSSATAQALPGSRVRLTNGGGTVYQPGDCVGQRPAATTPVIYQGNSTRK